MSDTGPTAENPATPPDDARLIAVDGGASGTRVRIADSDGRPLAEATAGPSSLSLGVDQAWRHIREALDKAAAELPAAGGATRIAAALAGSRNPENLAGFHASNPLGIAVTVMTDGYASLVGALGARPGTVAAVGTGVAVHRLHADGSASECSGWGFPAGDEGGGAWIGHQAIRWYLYHRDGRDDRASALEAGMREHLGATTAAIQGWLLGANATRYASLAPLVVQAAQHGDAISDAILDRAAAEVGQGIAALDRPDRAERVATIGGLGPAVAPRLPADQRQRMVPSEGNALDGLILVLRGLAPTEPRLQEGTP